MLYPIKNLSLVLSFDVTDSDDCREMPRIEIMISGLFVYQTEVIAYTDELAAILDVPFGKACPFTEGFRELIVKDIGEFLLQHQWTLEHLQFQKK